MLGLVRLHEELPYRSAAPLLGATCIGGYPSGLFRVGVTLPDWLRKSVRGEVGGVICHLIPAVDKVSANLEMGRGCFSARVL